MNLFVSITNILIKNYMNIYLMFIVHFTVKITQKNVSSQRGILFLTIKTVSSAPVVYFINAVLML